jgi:hypothetical protein
MYCRRSLGTVVALIVLFPCLASAEPTKVTACQVKANPAAFMHKPITIKGKVLADGMHATLILSGDCEKNGLLVRPVSAATAYNAEVLPAAVMRVGRPGTVDKNIDVTLSGTLGQLDDGRLVMDFEVVREMTLTYRPTDLPPLAD